MENANISTCANPSCRKEFRRLGEGKLFVRPARNKESGTAQKALWLCQECAEEFDLRYDRRLEEYSLIRRRRVA